MKGGERRGESSGQNGLDGQDGHHFLFSILSFQPTRPITPEDAISLHKQGRPGSCPQRPCWLGEWNVSAPLSSLNFQLSLKVITVAHAPVHRVGSVTEVRVPVDEDLSLIHI